MNFGKIVDNETFCIYPWTNIHTNTDGRCKLCCNIYTEDYITIDNDYAILGYQELDDIWHGSYMKEVRRKMLAGERVKACHRCYEHEEKGLQSSRQWANETFSTESYDPVFDPTLLELRLGNVCNLKCSGCWAVSSDQLYNERKRMLSEQSIPGWLARSWQHELDSVDKFDYNWFNTPMFDKFIDRVAPNLQRLYLTGGEPTLIQKNREILDKLVEVGNKDCYVCWTTNLTNWPEEFYDKLDFFHESEIQMSIDGFETSNSYIRYPTNWKSVEKNFAKAQQLPEKCILKVYFVYQAWNVYDVFNLVRWIEETQTRRVDFVPIFLESPDYIHSCVWPEDIREQIVDKLEGFDTPYFGAIQSIKNYTKNTNKYNPELINKMRVYIKYLDMYRKYKFSDVFPELTKVIQHAHPE